DAMARALVQILRDHLSDDELGRWAREECDDPDERDRVERHLQFCGTCRAELASFQEEADEALGPVEAAVPAGQVIRGRRRWWHAFPGLLRGRAPRVQALGWRGPALALCGAI